MINSSSRQLPNGQLSAEKQQTAGQQMVHYGPTVHQQMANRVMD